jgi:pimeloyl-ACP methyl ester carboxylesterase
MTSQTDRTSPQPMSAAASSSTARSSAPDGPVTEPTGRIGWIVAGSLATGLLAGLLLVAAPFIPAQESAVTGALLCGFAVGWAMLAMLSVRLTAAPQRWATLPAVFMGLGGLLLIGFGPLVRDVLDWIWPPALLALVVWVVVRARRQLPSRSSRLLLYPVLATLALASVGGGYATLGAASDATAYPMPGKLIDVGGHRLHLNCTGSGSPTVVVEAGGGEMSSNLGWISPALAHDTRVCVYDRAGRGWSEPSDHPQDGVRIATDLHTLLQRGNIAGPYVLAGHSFGGLYALAFAARYPDEVSGMVLVDSTAPASATHPGAAPPRGEGSYDVISRVSALLSTTASLGLVRLYNQLDIDSLPPRSADEVRARTATATSLRSTIDEYVQANVSMEQAASLQDFAAKPLVVLTAGSGSDATHLAAQNHLATLSTNSAHRVVDGATHEALIADIKHAATTTQAILDVVTSVRTAGRLAH